ncbi:hypothetical protein [uncultured Draconibacterium sp.]|uniref:hypothetical protein n=1 Tax=uncultured Draconibacterium sp. TaxID=1573823 RepID=UPI002AA85F64|nr:hypothetical protein [uncultured Draconibacterium sp.]
MPTINQQTSQPDEINSSRPNQPVATFLQEAENLYVWCVDDIPELLKAGIDEALINELPLRIKACRDAQTLWKKKSKTPGDAKVQWKLQLTEVSKLATELLRAMRFAFRNHTDLLARLNYLTKGNSYTTLIQQLNDLALLGRKNSQLLAAIGFDQGLLDTAIAKSKELASLWAQTKNENARLNEVVVARNKAFWTLQQQVSEIRAAGKYIFRHRKDRYAGYVSQYWKQKNGRRNLLDQ